MPLAVSQKIRVNDVIRFINEVKYHGKTQNDYSSKALNLLNISDFLVMSDGCPVSVKERLYDIAKRYDSSQYKEANTLAEYLNILNNEIAENENLK